jgi:hypothetical protein
MYSYPTPPFSYDPASASTRRGFGITQLIVTPLLAALWFFSGIGVAMCSDAGSSAFCSRVTNLWQLTGLALAANFVAGILLVATARRPGRQLLRRLSPWLSAAALVFLLAAGIPFLHLANGPVH